MFRETCRAFLYYSMAQDDISPEHDDCGADCIDCPTRTERESFEDSLKDSLTQKTGESWQDYGINLLLRTVIDISELEKTNSENWTIKTDSLVNILKSERSRIERIQRWNQRQTKD